MIPSRAPQCSELLPLSNCILSCKCMRTRCSTVSQESHCQLFCSAIITSLMSSTGRGDMLRGFDLAHLCKVETVPGVGPIRPTVLIKVEEKGKTMSVCTFIPSVPLHCLPQHYFVAWNYREHVSSSVCCHTVSPRAGWGAKDAGRYCKRGSSSMLAHRAG